ncbi:DUF3105 domain-containing protein [Planomonospora parontospora]|uniref:DUF3105 domain-containing protein n=1 Tax=Planomonospora parontospora TaxID=58119 RepID=UPI0016707BF2|nr:DUF3105 domain-containing protein [Planomonospora parontospora]GGL03540.1 membrane protein [Planomonospora parontospora subsp. antibiotica]GII13374.1 membrane protein [Planomonospora parontospora subsp. antibiotica]
MSKEKTQARRETLAKMRAEQKAKERRTALLMWGSGGLIILLLVGLVGFYLVNERAASSLDAVKSFTYVGSEHTTDPVTYKENPPVGGPHAPSPDWQNCGVYDQPVGKENAVHSMEHGAVWITYRPDLPKDQIEKLRELVRKQGDYMLLSPFPGIPSPIVASSWGKQLTGITDADDPRLPKFIAKFKNGPGTPELGAACSGGKGEPLP